MFGKWVVALINNRWFYLCHALIAMVVLFPYLDPIHSDIHDILSILLLNTAVIAAIIYSASPTRGHFIFGLCLGFPAILLFWLNRGSEYHLLILASIFAMYIYSISMAMRFLVRSKEFTLEQIFGGISVYLLIGLAWTLLYLALEINFPGSFAAVEIKGKEGGLSWSDFIYYSFTTLTTLGYGDITPITAMARSFAMLEAITGVIFVPVFISGIVSLSLSERLNKSALSPTFLEKTREVTE